VECFFYTDASTDYVKDLYSDSKYKDMDAVDLVIQSIGYHAKLDIPERKMFENPISPEFEKQGAFYAARFQEAHKITKGKGAKIAILDTGIDESHSIFENTPWGRHFSFVGRVGKPWEAEAPIIDWGGHGTLISSVATVYAPEAQITVYKFGDGDTQNDPVYQHLMQCIIAAAIYKAVHDGNDIISISASGASYGPGYLKRACRYAYDNNRILICGNLYHRWRRTGNNLNYPSHYDSVISVTAAEKRRDGSYGHWDICSPEFATTIAAPHDIFGAFPTYMDEKDTYIPSISAAIPTVSALAALVVSVYPRLGTEEPGEYAETIKKLIIDNANPQIVGYQGFSPECGYGMIDAEKTVNCAVLLNKKRMISSE
jgi:subtilisin family serine protease